MLICTDVNYREDGTARGAGVLFQDWTDSAPTHELAVSVPEVEPYQFGEFYRRELPCLLTLLEGVAQAAAQIAHMAGPGRLPTLLTSAAARDCKRIMQMRKAGRVEPMPARPFPSAPFLNAAHSQAAGPQITGTLVVYASLDPA
ncbi:hypothetical protein ACI3L1_11620 [Deinococcus sp. SM5_A1]|uniref:hypothetical protein n=1 Tax=Deinococcus sp. SM5_A1 TaxID=3379094 RepID=UPI00385FE8F5